MPLKISKQSWWETETYDVNAFVPPQLDDPALWGPKGAALVRAYPDGSTQPGWGLTPPKNSDEGFIPRYLRGEFLPRRTLYGYDKAKNAGAFVMRSARMLVIDIDGKNGGLQGVGQLGALPRTTAEISKSGNGYHLFYVTDESWDDVTGFGLFADHIGIVPGVDIRGVGCVYHFDTQRWNTEQPAQLPAHLRDKLLAKAAARSAAAVNIQKVTQTLDETEILVMQSDLLDELAKPIPAGKRNNTLFAIGSKLKAAQVPGWQGHLHARATDIGLDTAEADKLVHNVDQYGGTP